MGSLADCMLLEALTSEFATDNFLSGAFSTNKQALLNVFQRNACFAGTGLCVPSGGWWECRSNRHKAGASFMSQYPTATVIKTPEWFNNSRSGALADGGSVGLTDTKLERLL